MRDRFEIGVKDGFFLVRGGGGTMAVGLDGWVEGFG